MSLEKLKNNQLESKHIISTAAEAMDCRTTGNVALRNDSVVSMPPNFDDTRSNLEVLQNCIETN